MSALARSAAEGDRGDVLVRKAGEVSALVEQMRADMLRLQASEAVVRTTMAQALLSALAGRAALEADLCDLLAEARGAGAGVRAGFTRCTVWRLRPVLVRIGARGRALVLAAVLGQDMLAALSGRAQASPGLFDEAFYLSRYPDVAGKRTSPLLHYVLAGQQEGRDPHPLFDTAFYAERNRQAVQDTRLWPLAHFLCVGHSEGRDPHPLFDLRHYIGQRPLLAPGEDPVSHYMREGWRIGLSPHPLFDPAWYSAQMEAEAAETPPLAHYVLTGARSGLSPHPLFDPAFYRTQAPELEASGLDPLLHYLAVGAALRLSPSAYFDAPFYAARRGPALEAGADPLVDYLRFGAWQEAEPAPGFATAAYLAAHPELVAQRRTPLEHWARSATERPMCD